MKSASQSVTDPELLAELTRLLDDFFPRTKAFITSRLAND